MPGELVNPTEEVGALVLTLAATAIGAKRASGVIDNVLSWTAATGDVALSAPVGTDAGGGTRRIRLNAAVIARGSTLGAGGELANQNILLYQYSPTNWAGLQVDVNGNLSVNVGIAGRFSHVFDYLGGVKLAGNAFAPFIRAEGSPGGGGAGVGVEIFSAGTIGYLQSWNRTTGFPALLTLNASAVTVGAGLYTAGGVLSMFQINGNAGAFFVRNSGLEAYFTGVAAFLGTLAAASTFYIYAGGNSAAFTAAGVAVVGGFACNGAAVAGPRVSGGTLAGVIAGLVGIGLFAA